VRQCKLFGVEDTISDFNESHPLLR
jgi:hypothetical protein